MTKTLVPLCLILLLGAFLLFPNLAQYDIWGDEALTFPKGNSYSEVLEYTRHVGGTIHPPMYSLLQFFWVQNVAGTDLAANRLLWVIFGFAGLIAIYFLSEELFGNRIALLATFLCATSPFLVQYTRMVRYYPLTLLLAMLTLWAFYRLRRTNSWGDWIFFSLSGAAFIYEDYLAVFVFFFLYLSLLLNWQTTRRQLLKWGLAVVVMVVLFLPWLPNIFMQTGGGLEPYPERVEEFVEEAPRMAQKAVGLRSVLVNTVLKGGFLSYTFMVGETVYPWRWWMTLPLLLASGFLFIFALFNTRRKRLGNVRSLAIPLLAILITTVVISEIWGPFGSRMFQFPSKVLFLLPLIMMVVAAGICRFRKRIVQVFFILLLTAGHAYGLNNYFSGKQFLNPKFLAPWREVQSDIAEHCSPEDLIVTDEEAFLHNLNATHFAVESYGLVGAIEKVDSVRNERGSHTVYQVVRFRGDQTIFEEGIVVRDRLAKLHRWIDTWDYLPSDPDAAPFWKRILGTEPPPFLVQVFVFEVEADIPKQTN